MSGSEPDWANTNLPPVPPAAPPAAEAEPSLHPPATADAPDGGPDPAPPTPPPASASDGADGASSPPQNNVALFVVAAAVVLLLLAGGVVVLLAATGGAAKHTINGELDVFDSDATSSGGHDCSLSEGYGDIDEGTSVQVTNENGKVVGVGTLDSAKPIGESDLTLGCMYTFTVSSVPKAEIYNVEVAERGKVGYSYAEMNKNKWTVSIKLGSP